MYSASQPCQWWYSEVTPEVVSSVEILLARSGDTGNVPPYVTSPSHARIETKLTSDVFLPLVERNERDRAGVACPIERTGHVPEVCATQVSGGQSLGALVSQLPVRQHPGNPAQEIEIERYFLSSEARQ